MRKKILFIHPIIAPYRIDFINAFNKEYDISLYLTQNNLCSQSFNIEELYKNELDIEPHYLLKKWKLGRMSFPKGVINSLIKEKPDIVIVNEYKALTILVLLYNYLTFRRYKVVSIVDDSYDMVANGNEFSKVHRFATKVVAPFLDQIINVEPRVADWYQQHYGKGTYFPIIRDEDKIRRRLSEIIPLSEKFVEEYNLEGKKVLLFVGRLVGLKNIPFAIDAFIKCNDTNSVFVIIGDGPLKEELTENYAKYSNILFLGRLEGDNLYAWYNIAQIFTLQSTQEAFGAVTNEALLGGCYALISNVAGSNCLVEEGINGRIIDPYDKELYQEILTVSFSQIEPIVLPLSLRHSNMHERFNDCFNRMIESL